MPDWKSPETLERLIASLIAANGGKTDNQQIARFMDETYDAVENRTRVYKKQAQKLVKEAEETGRINQDMRKRGNTSPGKERATPKATPKKNAGNPHGVTSGRVTKTPTKKKSPVKLELPSSDSSVVDGGATATGTESFSFDDVTFGSGEWSNNDVA